LGGRFYLREALADFGIWKLGNLFIVETPLSRRNSLKADALRVIRFKENFPISQFPNSKMPKCPNVDWLK